MRYGYYVPEKGKHKDRVERGRGNSGDADPELSMVFINVGFQTSVASPKNVNNNTTLMRSQDDGSCLTLVVLGCTDSTYVEYDASANTDDGSCLTLLQQATSFETTSQSHGKIIMESTNTT